MTDVKVLALPHDPIHVEMSGWLRHRHRRTDTTQRGVLLQELVSENTHAVYRDLMSVLSWLNISYMPNLTYTARGMV